jgi:radical SAM enzyme (TIGR01210 family)
VRYPFSPAARTRWILERRGSRRAGLDAAAPPATLLETERVESGDAAPVLTVFLVNRECPWRCLMCDLWKGTLEGPAPPGAVAAQVDRALAAHPEVRRVKLYNAGSFFDPGAVAPADLAAVAARVRDLDSVTVEAHPALVGDACFRFAEEIRPARLEVAIGLETSHPVVLEKLNKRMTAEAFAGAARRLRRRGIALRTFVLVGLPFLSRGESLDWAARSSRFAFDRGASVVSLIPTRTGNGALEELERSGEFLPPTLAMLEAAGADAVRLSRGRAFVDLWDLDRLSACASCFEPRRARLSAMNLSQRVPPALACGSCGGSA